MSNDNTSDRLEQAVRDFRAIEEKLQQLAEQTEAVNGAGQQLESAREDLHQLQEPLTKSVQQQANLAGGLAEATQVIRAIDPSKIFGEIERLSADMERQGDRISETFGELRARIEAHETASEQRLAIMGRRLLSAMILAIVLSAAAVTLAAITLATS